MKKTLFLLTLTALCVTLIYPSHSFSQHFIDGQMPDTFLTGHLDSVNSVAFSPDGDTIASGSSDDTIKLWDVASGALKTTLEGHTAPVNSVAFSPDGDTIASGSNDDTIKLWDVASGALKTTLEGHTAPVNSVAFSPDGDTIASGSDDDTIKLWDVATGALKAILEGHTAQVNSVAFSPDGKTLASGSGEYSKAYHLAENERTDFDGTCILWEVATGTRIKNLTVNMDVVYSVTFSPDGKTLASGGMEYTGSRIHNNQDDNEISDLLGYLLLYGDLPVTLEKEGVEYYQEWDYIEVRRSIIDLWDVASGTLKATLEGYTDEIYSISFSPDGITLVSGSEDRTVQLWDITRQPKAPKATLSDHGDAVNSVAFSPDGTRLASGGKDGSIRIWTARMPINAAADVTIDDLVEVAENFGEVGDNEADINGDGIVNVVDLILVAVALGEGAAAPAARAEIISTLTAEEVAQWLIETKQLQTDNPNYLHGIRVLEQLHKALTPTQTALLANYPNPFNPETWIPYQLSTPVDVTLTIYTTDSKIVKTIPLGNMPAGNYKSRSRAAYWDGKNSLGESVASGVYFYTLTAGDFSATRKMLITK